jgi:hypothetical protein
MTAAQTFAMLDNQTLWDAAAESQRLLAAAGVPHAICGGVGVCLHGYRRNTVDVDLIVRRDDASRIRDTLGAAGWTWDSTAREFRTASGIAIQFLHAGDRAGKGSDLLLPDPGREAVTETIEGLIVLTLPRLIESKLACGEGSLRRTHKDFADVVELIAANGLTAAFAGQLHKSVRKTFKSLVRNANDG